MTRTIVIVCFLVAFAAGLTVGIETRRTPQSPVRSGPPERGGGYLCKELGLSSEQQQQLKQIWSEIAPRGFRERDEQRRALSRQREEAIAALIRPEDRVKYDEILKRYTEQTAGLDTEWRASWQQAVEKTRQILTPEQLVKYEAILQHHQSERGGPRGRHGGRDMDRKPGPRGPSGRPEPASTAPSA